MTPTMQHATIVCIVKRYEVESMARASEKELLSAEDVAGLIGVKETTVWRWCREGRLPCLKVGKHWRIRREALESFLEQSERSTTLVGQLSSFLRVPDSVRSEERRVGKEGRSR